MRVLMIGASGASAGMVLPELVQRGVKVRALVRSQQEASDALSRGAVETAAGDLNDPASLRAAADGMDGVFHIGPAFAAEESAMGISMVEAAVAAGVRRFCFSSVYHPSLSLGNHAAKRPVEEAVYHSGLEFTVLQPAMFMQTLDAGWAEVVTSGTVSGPYRKTAKVCYVDFRDVAEVAARALTEDAMVNGTFELCSPGMVDRVDLAALMSEVLGQTVAATETSFADAPMPAGPARDALALLMASYDRYGFAGGNAVVLRAVLGREPRSLTQYLADLAAR